MSKMLFFCGFVILADIFLPAKECSFIFVPERLQGITISYAVPYSGGDMASCLKAPRISGDYKKGTTLPLSKSRVLGLCSVSFLPNNWIEPEFGSWRSMENEVL